MIVSFLKKQLPVQGCDHDGICIFEKLEHIQSLWSDYFEPLEDINARFTLPSSVVFYGGTFEPWHQGHQACIKLFQQQHPDKLVVLVPDCNPDKIFLKNTKALKAQEALTKLVNDIKGQEGNGLKTIPPIYPGFLMQKEKNTTFTNPTASWLTHLHLRYQKTHNKSLTVGWLMGFDQLRSLPQWRQSHRLPSLIQDVYVVSRLESEQQREQTFVVLETCGWKKQQFHYLGKHQYEHISSSALNLE